MYRLRMNAVFCTIFQSIIYHYRPKQYQGKRMNSIMTRSVKMERENQYVLTACRIMHENDIGSIIIVKRDANNNQLV
jgi:predicted transcriptional regulator